MKLNKRKLLRYRIAAWVVIAMVTLQSGPLQVWAALNQPAGTLAAAGSAFAGEPLPVDFESGALVLQLEDLTFRNDELPLALNRVYRSDLEQKSRGVFGNRWHSLLDMQLTVEDDSTIGLTDELGRARVYRRSAQGCYLSQRWDYEELHLIEGDGQSGYERRLKSGVSYVFAGQPDYRLTQIKDRNGRFLKVERDQSSGIVSITDRYGRWIQVALKGGYAVAARDSLERELQYSYDANGNLAGVTTPGGGQYAFFYDSQSRIARFNMGDQRWYGFKYLNNRIAEQRGPAGRIAGYDYQEEDDGLHLTITDAVNCQNRILFGKKGDITATDPSGAVSRLWRNERLLPVKGALATGEMIDVVYDDKANVTQITRNGAVTRITYNPLNLMASVQLPSGELTAYDYDSRGNPVTLVDAYGTKTVVKWNEQGLLAAVTHPTGRTAALTYDQYGLPASLSDNISGVYQMEFAPTGLMSAYESPTGVRTTLKYNAAGFPIVIENSEEQRIDLFLDQYGNLTKVRDAEGNSASFSYDSMGMLTASEDPLGASIEFAWRENGLIRSLTDAAQNTTRWDYDQAGRLQSESNAAGAVRKVAYDAAGRPSEYTNARGQAIKMGYDEFGRLNALISGSENSLLRYDQSGRMVEMKNAHSEYRAEYGGKGELTAVADGVLKSQVGYEYDALGRRSRMITPDGVVSYTYDGAGRMESIAKNGQSIVFAFDQFGRRSKMTFSNGVVTDYTYDRLNRVTDITARNSRDETLTAMRYTYDRLDRVVRTVDSKGVDKHFEYDAKSQLVKVVQGASVTEYQYDPAGNRRAVVRDGERVEYQTGLNNQLLRAGKESFEYDADGNLTRWLTEKGESFVYQYDESGRMFSVQGPNGSAEYRYAPNSIRIARKVDEQETRYLFDGGDIISEISDGKTKAEYLHGPGVDEWLMVEREGGRWSCHSDRMGSVLAQADVSGNLSETFAYDEFGRPDARSSQSSLLTSYTGREWDPLANMHYYRARFYSPSSGRFNALDPLGLTQGQNQYAYVYNNPLTFKDPSGQIAILALVAIGVVAGGLFDLGWQGVNNWSNGQSFLHDINGWSIAGSAALGALAPLVVAIGTQTIAALGALKVTGTLGVLLTRFVALGPQVVGTIISSVLSGVLGAFEYIGRVLSGGEDFDFRRFIFNIGNRSVSFIFSVFAGSKIGPWVRSFAPWIRSSVAPWIRRLLGPRGILELISTTIGGFTDWVYSAISDQVQQIVAPPAGSGGGGVITPFGGTPGSPPGSGGSGGGTPGFGGGGGGGGSFGGSSGNSDEYKRFRRFEGWSN